MKFNPNPKQNNFVPSYPVPEDPSLRWKDQKEKKPSTHK